MHHKNIVLGAGPAGLAAAAALKMAGEPVHILERAADVGTSWQHHYKRLHLHTPRGSSGLPGLKMPGTYPKYPSRQQVVDYLGAYASHHQLEISFGTEVVRISHGESWQLHTAETHYSADNVIIATGFAQSPTLPDWAREYLINGDVIHSSKYEDPSPYLGKKVLVVGFGNSGGEIALDLAEAGVETHLSIRGPLNIVPRDLLGVPILTLTILQRWLPYKVADVLNAPILRLFTGNTRKLGILPPSKGPMAQVIEDGKIPVLDIGALTQMRNGNIEVHPGVHEVTDRGVTFLDGNHLEVDHIILATGYHCDLRPLLPDNSVVLNNDGRPLKSGAEVETGLFFINFQTVPTGQLRQCAIEAKRIASAISSKLPNYGQIRAQ